MRDKQKKLSKKRFDRADQGRAENELQELKAEFGKSVDTSKASLQSEMDLQKLREQMEGNTNDEVAQESEENQEDKGFGTETQMQREKREEERGAADVEHETDDVAKQEDPEPPDEEGMAQAG